MKLLLGIGVLFVLFGCSSSYRLTDEVLSQRANVDLATLESATADVAREETSQDVRNIVHQAICKDMMMLGRHPKSAIDASELMSLVQVPPTNATGTSRVNYRARVRLNFARHWLDVEYLVYERNGAVIVRRISL